MLALRHEVHDRDDDAADDEADDRSTRREGQPLRHGAEAWNLSCKLREVVDDVRNRVQMEVLEAKAFEQKKKEFGKIFLR